MPHVIIKLWPGRTEEQKIDLTNRIVEAVTGSVCVPESSVSVAIEEIPKEKWADEVYKPDIIDKENTIYRKPGIKSTDRSVY